MGNMEQINKHQIAVWQPYFRGGGAEAVALWILEALQDDYTVILHTLSPVDLSWLNTMYNTNLSHKNLIIKTYLPKWLEKQAYDLMASHDLFRIGLVYWTIRGFKKINHQYDLVFSAFNALDMGRPGIQYLHWVNVVEKPYERAPLWQKALMHWIDFSHDRLRQNNSIANSQYTAQRVQQTYGIEADVVFPPVVTEIPALPWTAKEDAFLCSGRIVQAKQTHRVINILQAVRSEGFDIKLHITGGGGGGGVYGQTYLRKIKELAKENSDWIFIHQNLPYDDYLKIVGRCRYGIHYKPEPFGISVAEMLKADMIPFVRSKGGQMEIVGSEHPELLFDNEADGVQKIIKVLGSQATQETLLASLKERQSLFSTERFMTDIRALVNRHLKQSKIQNIPAQP